MVQESSAVNQSFDITTSFCFTCMLLLRFRIYVGLLYKSKCRMRYFFLDYCFWNLHFFSHLDWRSVKWDRMLWSSLKSFARLHQGICLGFHKTPIISKTYKNWSKHKIDGTAKGSTDMPQKTTLLISWAQLPSER